MRICSRLIAVFLMTPFLTAMLSTQSLALPTMPHEHPAGCHENGPATPTPAPGDYQCCVMGHHWAMPGAGFSGQRLVLHAGTVDTGPYLSISMTLDGPEKQSVVSSASPPLLLSLRI